MTFDDFFSQKLYASYLLGDSNMFNRMLLDYVIDPAKVRKEQNRIENELLNFEQDLWEYWKKLSNIIQIFKKTAVESSFFA